MTLDLFSAFIIGLIGSGHCIAMCGGITTMLTSALPHSDKYKEQKIPVNNQNTTDNFHSKVALVTCYNIGRISSYALIGAIVGFTGSIAAKNIGMPLASLRIISSIFMILLGLYIGQWLMWLNRIEALGKILWRYISPLASNAIPVNSPYKALILGCVWGWLPCGLVYSVLTWSLASGSAFQGALIMAGFGIGTLPIMILMATGFEKIQQLLQSKQAKILMGLLLVVFACNQLFKAISGSIN